MKIIFLIFPCYILLLNAYPCSDVESCPDEQAITITNTVNTQHTNETEDFCSPFCNCACCSINLNISPLPNLDLAIVVHNTQVTIPYVENRVSPNYHSIWQPPKI